MKKTFEVIRSRDLADMFAFFGLLDASPERIKVHRRAIQASFALEVAAIVHICSKLPEHERFKLFREALRRSYESAVPHAATITDTSRAHCQPEGQSPELLPRRVGDGYAGRAVEARGDRARRRIAFDEAPGARLD